MKALLASKARNISGVPHFTIDNKWVRCGEMEVVGRAGRVKGIWLGSCELCISFVQYNLNYVVLVSKDVCVM